MRLRHLELYELRCHPSLVLATDAPVVVLDGDNGAGKTTVLEAISLICTLKSFREASNRELLRRAGGGRALVRANIVSAGLERLAELELEAAGRVLRFDGKRPESMRQWFQAMKCVSFAPEDLAMVRGAPELRRAFLDRACFTLDPGHLDRVRAFKKALDQRNAALKAGLGRAELEVWTESFLVLSDKLRSARRRALDLLLPSAEIHYRRFAAGADGPLSLTLHAAGGPDLAAALERSAGLERARRSTQVGPQRDAVEFRLGDLDLRSQGSQGQARSAALAIKLALLETAAARTGVTPILLLDDVGSELDPGRIRALLERVLELSCQTFITTTRRDYLPKVDPDTLYLRIEPGHAR